VNNTNYFWFALQRYALFPNKHQILKKISRFDKNKKVPQTTV